MSDEYEWAPLRLPPDVTRISASTRLSIEAEYRGWELTRVRLYTDGSRRAFLPAPQNPPASLGVEPYSGQLPPAVFRLDRQPGRRTDPGHVRRQAQRGPLVLVGHLRIPACRQPAVT